MANPARKFEVEYPLEARITRLEATTDHIQSDVTEIKDNLKRLDAKIDALRDHVATFEGKMRDAFESIRVGRAMDKVWALLAMGTLLGVMARGFKWI